MARDKRQPSPPNYGTPDNKPCPGPKVFDELPRTFAAAHAPSVLAQSSNISTDARPLPSPQRSAKMTRISSNMSAITAAAPLQVSDSVSSTASCNASSVPARALRKLPAPKGMSPMSIDMIINKDPAPSLEQICAAGEATWAASTAAEARERRASAESTVLSPICNTDGSSLKRSSDDAGLDDDNDIGIDITTPIRRRKAAPKSDHTRIVEVPVKPVVKAASKPVSKKTKVTPKVAPKVAAAEPEHTLENVSHNYVSDDDESVSQLDSANTSFEQDIESANTSFTDDVQMGGTDDEEKTASVKKTTSVKTSGTEDDNEAPAEDDKVTPNDDEAAAAAEPPALTLLTCEMKRKDRILDPFKPEDAILISKCTLDGPEIYDDDAAPMPGKVGGNVAHAELYENVNFGPACYVDKTDTSTPFIESYLTYTPFVPGRFERMSDGTARDQKHKLIVRVFDTQKNERLVFRNQPPKDWNNQVAITTLNKRIAQQYRRNSNIRFRQVMTPYCRQEREWILKNLAGDAKPKKGWKVFVYEFNKEWAGKMMEGCAEPRQERTHSSLTKEVERFQKDYVAGRVPSPIADKDKRAVGKKRKAEAEAKAEEENKENKEEKTNAKAGAKTGAKKTTGLAIATAKGKKRKTI